VIETSSLHSSRRTEKIDPAQLSLLLSQLPDEDKTELADLDDSVDDHSVDTGATDTDEDSEPKRRPRRKRPPKDLPRKVLKSTLKENARLCPCCHEPMAAIGEDVSELLELVPAYFRVLECHQTKYACSCCKAGIITAPGPAKLIERGLAAPSLLAHVVQSKYDDHLPLNRLSRIYARGGVDIAVSTMVGWVAAVANELEPVVAEIRKRAMASFVLQTDGSGLKVLDRDHPGGVRKGTMWCTVGERKWVVFDYAETGSGKDGPWTLLKGRTGYLQADASNTFDRLFNGKVASAIEQGCLAHARRRFHKLKDSDPRAAVPIKLLAKLYRVEREAKTQNLNAAARHKLRHHRTTAILAKLKEWLVRTASREPPEGAMAQACAYSINHWDALTRFMDDGRLGPDNNLCELQIRSLAVGRRNYLFAGSDSGAKRAAVLYSILRTCALHHVDGYAYLIDVFEKLASNWPNSRIAELLPDAYAARRDAETPKK